MGGELIIIVLLLLLKFILFLFVFNNLIGVGVLEKFIEEDVVLIILK